MSQDESDLWSLPIDDLPGRLEAALGVAETALGVVITLRDHAGIWIDAHGNLPLPPARFRHERVFCNAGRDQTVHDQACLSHCGRDIPLLAATHRHPFVHRCWKGAAEIVVPIHHDGVHVCSLFAGTWASDRVPNDLPEALETLRRVLPPMHGPTLARLAGPLTLVGAGLIATWLQARDQDAGEERSSIIRRYLHLHVHEDIHLADLARHLGLSTSRASRLVREACGRTFQDAVLHERIHRAQAMLRQSHRPARLIAERLGFDNEYYFNRAFRKVVGIPPGRWRRQYRQNLPPPSV